MNLSICIPHHGEPTQLYFTVHSMEQALQNTGITYEYRIVSNGAPLTENYCFNALIDSIKATGHLGNFEHVNEALTPQDARQRAATGARGDILWFGDCHVLVSHDFFTRGLQDLAKIECDALFPAYKFMARDNFYYHYDLSELDKGFWGRATFIPKAFTPYRIASANHACFLVKRDAFESIGGYGPEGLFKGWAAEEPYLNLKMALFDKTIYLNPMLSYFHLPSARGYPRHYCDNYFRNLMTCALVIGGESWIDRVYARFRNAPAFEGGTDIYTLYEQAHEIGAEHAAHLASIRHRTLDEQLEKFKQDGVAH